MLVLPTRLMAPPRLRRLRTNLCLYSQEIDRNAVWSTFDADQSQPLVTPNTTVAPDGTMTADTVTYGSEDWEFRSQAVAVANDSQAYTGTVYVRPGTAVAWQLQMTLAGGTGVMADTLVDNAGAVTFTTGSGTSTGVGGGWFRIEAHVTNNSSGNTTLNFTLQRHGSDAGTVTFWGAQLETGGSATAYIATTDAARSAS